MKKSFSEFLTSGLSEEVKRTRVDEKFTARLKDEGKKNGHAFVMVEEGWGNCGEVSVGEVWPSYGRKKWL